MNSTNVNKFTLTREKNGYGKEPLVLRKNGNICSCPFRNPTILPHPSIQGQMMLQNPICSDLCQFFNLLEGSLTLQLNCSDIALEVLIEK